MIVCADDYGLSPAVNRGILEALKTGHVSAVSVLVNHLEKDWVAPLLEASTRIDLGLHLEIGHPLRQRAFLRELEGQVEGFFRTFGRAPDFIDGHRHVHALPAVRRTLYEILRKNPKLRPRYVRGFSLSFPVVPSRETLQRLGLALVWNFRKTNWKDLGIGESGGTVLLGVQRTRNLLPSLEKHLGLPRSPGETILCVHPGHVDDVLRRKDPVTAHRTACLELLADRNFRRLMENHGGINRYGKDKN